MLTRYRFRGFIAQRVTPRYVSLLPVFVFSGGIFTSSSFVSIGRASSMAVAGLSITGEGSATVRCSALVLFSPIAASADRLFNSIVRAVETRRSPALQEVVHCCGTAPLRRAAPTCLPPPRHLWPNDRPKRNLRQHLPLRRRQLPKKLLVANCCSARNLTGR